jgi:hypothetical protein
VEEVSAGWCLGSVAGWQAVQGTRELGVTDRETGHAFAEPYWLCRVAVAAWAKARAAADRLDMDTGP